MVSPDEGDDRPTAILVVLSIYDQMTLTGFSRVDSRIFTIVALQQDGLPVDL